MNGHTNNRILRACLTQQYRDAKRKVDTEKVAEANSDYINYYEGHMSQCVNIGILLGVIHQEADFETML